MKKVLFGTTALLGGLLLTQGAMAAETTVKLGGDIRFDAGFIDDDLENASDVVFLQEFRLPITMDAVADNGLKYGAMVRIRNTGQDGDDIVADRRFIYVGGDWGRVELGDEWGPTTKLEVLAPNIGIGQLDGTLPDFTDVGNFAYSHALEYGRSTKVAYYTPRFAGFQAGVSYMPQLGQRGDVASNRSDAAGQYSDVVETALQYEGDFGDFGLRAGAGYSFGDLKPAQVGILADDLQSYYAGAQVIWGGFTVGGGYFDNNETSRAIGGGDQDGWNIGATYTTGPFAVAANYGRTQTNDTDDDVFVVGANYTVAPGLSVAADVYFFDIENADAASHAGGNNEGTVAVLRTRLTF
ncbi:MAG TPA: porin [Arenibaculum sp.]|nr:porin [Arenibaculum sp.]